MKPQSQDAHVQHQFDAYVKKVLKYAARDYYQQQKQQGEREISLNDVSEQDLVAMSVMDEYFQDTRRYRVLEYDISISDETLAEALHAIPADRRDIILLAYFLDMPDREIAERLNLVRRTVAYRRANTLSELRKIMEGQADE